MFGMNKQSGCGFVTSTPLGYRGGDTNLYRYCFNDPVNHTDPSGNAILIDPCPDSKERAPIALRDLIFSKFFAEPKNDAWKNKDDVTFRVTAAPFVQGRQYRELDIYHGLPPEAWGIIQEKGGSGNYEGGFLLNASQGVLKADLEKAAAFNQVYFPGAQKFSDPPPEAEKPWGRRLAAWIESLGGQLVQGLTWLVQQGCELGSVGIGKLIQLAEFSPSDIEKFNEFSQYFCNLIVKGVSILDRLFKGAGDGVKGFVDHAPKYLQAAIETLVGKDAKLLFETLTAKKIDDSAVLDAILQLLGYTLDDLIGLVQETFTQSGLPDPTALILLIAEELEPFLSQANSTDYKVDGPDIKFLKEYLSNALSSIDDLSNQLSTALTQSATEIVAGLGGQVSELLLKKLVAVLLPGGGLITLVQRLVGMVTWFQNNKEHFETLWEDAKGSVEIAVGGASDAQAKIAKKIEDGLAKLLPILLSGSAKFLTGYTPAEFVNKAFMGLKKSAQKPVRVVLTGIAKQLSKVFEQLLQRLLPSGAGSPPPLLAPIRFGSENEKRLWVANDGTVMVKASPNQTNYLKTTNLSDADKKKAEKLAQQISATAKTLAASTKTKQDRASLKQANELKTKIEGLEKELAKLLGVSADCAKVLVHNASAPANCECAISKNVTKRPTGPGGRFEVNADVVSGTENDANPKVCRIHWIHGPLSKTMVRGGSGPQNAMIAFLLGGDSSTYDAGHVIGDTLGGPNTTLNLVPMTRSFNREGGWKSIEDRISKCLSDPQNPPVNSMSMDVQLTYPASGKKQFVPGRLTVTLTVNGDKKHPIVFPNTDVKDGQVFKGLTCTTPWT